MRLVLLVAGLMLAPFASADLTNVLFADDAGTGTDAPELPSGRIVVQPGTLYHGAIQGPHGDNTVDPWDLYAVHLREGQTIQVWARGAALALSIRDDTNKTYGSDVATSAIAMFGLEFTAPVDGRYHIEILGQPQPYCFAFSLEGGPTGHLAPPGSLSCSLGVDIPAAPALASPIMATGDAGSGRDAPNGPDEGLPIATGVAYEGMLAGAAEGRAFPREDIMDAYAFEARAGQRIDVTYLAPAVLAQILAPDGTSLDTDSTTGFVWWDGLVGTATMDGTYIVRFLGTPQGYCFQVNLDGTAPADLLDAPACAL